jgi:hypothetical protein
MEARKVDQISRFLAELEKKALKIPEKRLEKLKGVMLRAIKELERSGKKELELQSFKHFIFKNTLELEVRR